MKKTYLAAILFVTPIIGLCDTPIIQVDLIPPYASFSSFGVIEGGDFLLTESNKSEFLEEVIDPFVNEIKNTAINEKQNRILLFSNPGSNKIDLRINGVEGVLSIPSSGQRIFVLFFNEHTPADHNRFIPFTADPPDENIIGVRYEIDLKVNTADITKSHWVYLNLPKFQDTALRTNATAIYIESTKDSNYEEVFLPQLEKPIKISNQNPLLKVFIYNDSNKVLKQDGVADARINH